MQMIITGRLTSGMLKTFRYVFGFTADWRDSRPASLSVGLVRIGLFIAMAWVNLVVQKAMLNGDVAAFAALRATGNYTPFGLLMLFGETPPSPAFWSVVQVVSWIATCLAILGVWTRLSMVVSTLSVMMLVLLDASQFIMWSHPYNVIFLCAIPFMFSQAGRSLSVDRWLARKWPGYLFAPAQTPVFWAVLAVQYSAALFYFGAFWAKFVVSNGTIDYIFSDNMRNMLAVTWYGYMQMAVPSYIVRLGDNPWLWQGVAAMHLFMQAIVVMIFFAVHRPHARFAEGIIFAVSCIGLYWVMSINDPWWLLLVAAFIDWDYYLPKARHKIIQVLGGQELVGTSSATSPLSLKKPVWLISGLALFYAVYCVGFLTQRADKQRIYPFSNMDMYAAVYAMKPYNQHLPYVDIMRGNITIELPEKQWAMDGPHGRWIRLDQMNAEIRKKMLPRVSRKTTHDMPVLMEKDGATIRFLNVPDTYPLLAREMNLSKLEASMKAFLEWLGPEPKLPNGSKLVLRQQTIAFSAYPEPLGHKEVYHSGIRAVYDITRDVFVGASPSLDHATRVIHFDGVGIKRAGKLYASGGVLAVATPEDYVEIEGRWTGATTFEIDKDFYARYAGKVVNVLIEAETQLGTYRFDGPTVRW